jgi:hypothetical protein
MKLKQLHVYTNYDKTIRGTMTVDGETAEIQLKLTEEQCHKVIAVVAGTLVENATELSKGLLAQTIDFHMGKQIAAPAEKDITDV